MSAKHRAAVTFGKLGGASKSDRKAAASRANGCKPKRPCGQERVTSFFKNAWGKLRDRAYREQLVASQAKLMIPLQLRAIMKERGITQSKLAEASALTQGVVSRAADPTYGNLSMNTIVRLAGGLDMAFIGLFVPFSRLLDYLDRMDELGRVPTFQEEDATRDSAEELIKLLETAPQ